MISPQTHNRLYDSSNANPVTTKILKALIIFPNQKTTDLGSLLAIARREACKREHIQDNPTIRSMVFVPELNVYVAIYESVQNSGKTNCERQGDP